ncbi:MAG: hypothetical protein PHY47_07390 [Lachnospiraceae bacterium]|nr:hypothetical protein [Lachnospiraceae bacterium]
MSNTNTINKKIDKANVGREVWKKLTSDFGIDHRTYCIVLSSQNNEYDEMAIRYIDKLIEKKNGKKAYFLTCRDIKAFIQKYQSKAEFIILSKEDIHDIIQFYQLYEFSPNFIIASLEEPDGRKGVNLCGINGLTLEEIFKTEIYDLADE